MLDISEFYTIIRGESHMKNINIYDDKKFFESYNEMPRSKDGLRSAGEWHQLKKLFPDL